MYRYWPSAGQTSNALLYILGLLQNTSLMDFLCKNTFIRYQWPSVGQAFIYFIVWNTSDLPKNTILMDFWYLRTFLSWYVDEKGALCIMYRVTTTRIHVRYIVMIFMEFCRDASVSQCQFFHMLHLTWFWLCRISHNKVNECLTYWRSIGTK